MANQNELGVAFRYLPDKYKKAYEEGDLSDDDIIEWGRLAGVLRQPEKPKAKPAEKPAPRRNALDSVGDAAKAGLRSTGSGMLQGGIDAEEVGKREAAKPWHQRDLLDYVGFGPDERARADADIVSAIQGYKPGETYGDIQKRMEQQAEVEKKRVEQDVMSLDNSALRTGARAVTDAAGSPLSYLSVFGGPVGALSGVDSYARTYREARKAGVSVEEAQNIAREAQVTESAIGMIPAAKLLGPLAKIGANSSSRIARAASGIGRNAVGEGLNEVATEAFQMGRSLERSAWDDDKKVREYSEAQLPKTVSEGAEGLFRTFMAGAAGGSVMSAPSEMWAATKQVADKAADQLSGTEGDTDEDFDKEVLGKEPAATRVQTPEPVQESLFGELPTNPNFEADRQRELEMDAAFTLNRRQTAETELREREVLGVQAQLDAARQQVEGLQDRVQSGQHSNADLTALGAATRRMRGLENMLGQLVQQQPEARVAAPAAAPVDPVQQELAVTTKQPNELRLEAARAEARKRLEKDKKDIQKAATTKRNAALKQHTTSLMNQARDMEPEQAEQFVAENLVQWEDANPIENFIKAQRETLVMGEANRNQRRAATTTRRNAPAANQQEDVNALFAELGPDVTKGSDKPVTVRKMIVSGGSTADIALQEGRTWESIDGKRKYEISDNESSLDPEGVERAINSQEAVRAGDVLKHDRLYQEFPEMAEVPVRVIYDPDSPYGGGYNRPTDDKPLGELMINVADDTDDPTAFDSAAHRSIIHEMQHAVQARSGTTGGGQVMQFMSERGNELREQIRNINAAIGAAQDLGYPERDIANLRAEELSLMEEYNDEWDMAANQYRKVLGEQEAYSTQDRLALTDEQRQADTLTRERDIIQRDGVSLGREGQVLATRNDQARTSPGQVPNDFFNGVRDMKTMLLKLVENSDIPSYKELAAVLSASRWAPTVGVMRVQNRADLHPELRAEFESGAVGLAAFSADDGQPFLYFDPTREGGVRAEAVVHESIHALTEAALKRNPKIRKDLERIAGNVRAVLVRENMTEALKHWDLGIQNNAGELLAYGLTSPMFRGIFRKLDENGNVPGEKNPSIWQKIADFVFDALAIPARFRPRWNANIGNTQPGRVRPLTSKLNDSLKQLMSDTEEKGTSTHSTIRAFRIQDLTAARERMADPDNKALQIMRNGLSAFGPLGRQLANMKRLADSFAASRSHNAANHFHELNRSIEHTAKMEVAAGKYKDQNAAEQALRNQIERAMKVMEGEPSMERRRAILDALIRRYPALKGLNAAIDEVNELSRSIAHQILEANPNPTEAELALVRKIINSQYGYATRMFAAFQGEAGRAYAKRIKSEYDKAQKALKNGKAVPEKYKDSYRVWSNAVRYLINNDLSIPSEADLVATSTDRLARLYDTWVGDAARIRANAKADALARGSKKREADLAAREAMIAGLLDRAPDISKPELEGMAEKLVLGMMGLAEAGGPFASYYRGFKEDRGILNKREDLPQEIKDLFGEINDPATRLAITIAKQAELAGRQRLLLDMRDVGIGKWIVKSSDAGKPGNERFTHQLKGEGYGPLDGYYADPAIAAAISDSLEMFSTMGDALAQGYQNSNAFTNALARKGVEGLAKLAGWQKLATVVFDIYNMGMNAVGSPIMLVANGIYNPLQWKDGIVGAVEVIWDAGSQGQVKLSPATQDAIRYGVLDSARVQEIRKTPQEFVRGLISKKPKAMSMVGKGWDRTIRTSTEAFAMADAWVKIVAFQERTETLRKFYEAEGIAKTEHELKTEASDHILDTNITYQRVGTAIRSAERLGFTTFMPYFVSVPRAITYNTILATKDMLRAIDAKTPEGKMAMGMSAIRRMSGTAVATGGMVIGMKALAAAVNDEEEDKIAAMQKLLFPDARFADSLYLGKDAEGIPLFARMSRIDPMGPVNDFARILFDDYTPAPDKRRYMVEMLRDMVITNRVVLQGMETFGDLMDDEKVADKDTKMERIFPKLSETAKAFVGAMPGLDNSDGESVLAFIDTFTPGFMDAFDPKNVKVKEASESGAAELSTMITLMGGRLDRADPGLAVYVAGKEIETARKAGRKRQSDGFKAGEDPKVLERRFLDDARDEHAAMRDAVAVWEGMTDGLGMTPRQARQMFKDKAGSSRMTETDYRNLQYGRVSTEAHEWIVKYSGLLNEDSQEKLLKGHNEKRKLTPEEKQKLRTYLENMKALGYKVQE